MRSPTWNLGQHRVGMVGLGVKMVKVGEGIIYFFEFVWVGYVGCLAAFFGLRLFVVVLEGLG